MRLDWESTDVVEVGFTNDTWLVGFELEDVMAKDLAWWAGRPFAC